jgi:hypothetical protein
MFAISRWRVVFNWRAMVNFQNLAIHDEGRKSGDAPLNCFSISTLVHSKV